MDSIALALKDLYPFEAIQQIIKMNCNDLNTIDPEKVAKSCACNLLRYSSPSDNSKKSSGLPIDDFVQKVSASLIYYFVLFQTKIIHQTT